MTGSGIGRYLAVAVEVARKDFRLEARAKRAVPMAAALALLIVVVFAFSFEDRGTTSVLWVAFVFAGTLSVMRSLRIEAENDALDAVLLAPIPHSAVYLGKVISATAFVSVVGAFTLGATRLFLGAAPGVSPVRVLATIVLFAIGFAAVSVLLASIAVYTRITDLLLPVLLIPLVVPALLAGIELVGGGGTNWFTVLLGYDGIVLVSGLLVFEELVV
ncbi:MAG: heme exporter protein B [Halobacteriales archaeon]|jgi:heme exporter protein B